MHLPKTNQCFQLPQEYTLNLLPWAARLYIIQAQSSLIGFIFLILFFIFHPHRLSFLLTYLFFAT